MEDESMDVAPGGTGQALAFAHRVPQGSSLRVGFPLRYLARDLLTRHLARDLSQGFLVTPLGLPLLSPSLFFTLLRRSPVPVGRGVGDVGPKEVDGNREDDG